VGGFPHPARDRMLSVGEQPARGAGCSGEDDTSSRVAHRIMKPVRPAQTTEGAASGNPAMAVLWPFSRGLLGKKSRAAHAPREPCGNAVHRFWCSVTKRRFVYGGEFGQGGWSGERRTCSSGHRKRAGDVPGGAGPTACSRRLNRQIPSALVGSNLGPKLGGNAVFSRDWSHAKRA
jgi:hypothetical protein